MERELFIRDANPSVMDAEKTIVRGVKIYDTQRKSNEDIL